ncbi:MAG: HAMP domain-containing histidine kinase [Peptococcaceae bacterium]|jgi:two-component system OmpR family sensor kinase|nr:HAMP domain-containing histidine kinase [Peptococcaceae bacterium]
MKTKLFNLISKISKYVVNWKRSLVGQLLLRLWFCFIIFFTIIGSIQYDALKNSLYHGVEQNLISDYNSIRSSMQDWLGRSVLPPGRFADLRPGNFVAFYSANSEPEFIVYSYGPTNYDMSVFIKQKLSLDLYQKALENKPFIYTDSANNKYMLLVQPVVATGYQRTILGYAVMGEPLFEEGVILNNSVKSYIFNALLVMLVSTLLSAYALHKPLEPLLNISSTARKIAGGRYDLRLPYQKTSFEIEQLREALNHMLGQLEMALNTERRAKENMSRFIADASHELRTPLTSIRGFLEILQRGGARDKEILDSAHQTMLIETERLIRLTESLLTLNRLAQEDPSGEQTQKYACTLKEVIPELLPLLNPLLDNRTLKINTQVIKNAEDPNISIPVQTLPLKPDELKQILYNLLNNAIQHTENDGTICILTGEEESKTTITIQDNGQGIPSEDLPYIFERFFRGDRSRSHTRGQGSGLGLAIVSELVRIRGGKIKVESSLGTGTSFIIFFPRIEG